MNDSAKDSNRSHNDFADRLAQYRTEIDAIDVELIDLILKRSAVVSSVGKLKESNRETTCPIRPAREAAQLRKMMERFSGEAFPSAAAVHVWRHIINGSLAIEGALPIGVCSPVGAASDLVWMAREYFGAYADMTRESQPRALVNKVVNNQCAIGVLPYPHSEDTNPWWLDLANEGDNHPTIFLKLPHLPEQQAKHGNGNGGDQAFAIAKVAVESYGEQGISAIVMRTENTCSMSKLQDTFKRAGFDAQWLSVVVLSEMERGHFVEIQGDIAQNDSRLEVVREAIGKSFIKLSVIGRYAAPLTTDSTK